MESSLQCLKSESFATKVSKAAGLICKESIVVFKKYNIGILFDASYTTKTQESS